MELQVKLLRVLETGRFMRVGSTQTLQTDVRVIAATNRCPFEAVASGRLREDLLYRLNVFPIELPPRAPVRRPAAGPALAAGHLAARGADQAVHGVGPEAVGAAQLARQCARAAQCRAACLRHGARPAGRHRMAAPPTGGHCPARPHAGVIARIRTHPCLHSWPPTPRNCRPLRRPRMSPCIRSPTTARQATPTTCPIWSRPPYSCPSA